MKLKCAIIIPVLVFALNRGATGAVTSVTVTPAPTTTLSNGNTYYCAGVSYTFRVQALDPAATGKTYWNQIILRIRQGGINRETVTVNVGPDTTAGITGFDPASIVVTDNTTVYTNLDYTITVRFQWDCVEFAAAGTNDVQAFVSEDGATNQTDTNAFNFGVVSSIAVFGFSQDGAAADGRINPWHTAFNVTGTIVYNVPGATLSDKVYFINGGAQLTSARLLLDGADTTLLGTPVAADAAFINDGITADLNFSIPLEFMNLNAIALGNRTWTVRAVFTTPGGPDVSINNIIINVDRIRIDAITFINGGGVNAPYYRSTLLAGTQVQISASRQSGAPGALPMIGNTTIRINDGTNTFNVQILNGQISGAGNVTYPTLVQVPNTQTVPLTYQVDLISGSAYDNEQNDPLLRITQPANPVINWDNNDPPGNNGAPFTPYIGNSATASSLTLNWTPLTAGAPDLDGDFNTYRIYYKRSVDPAYTIVDRSTPDYGLGGAADTYRLDLITTGTASITGLASLTDYDFYITAVDVFGQEVTVANGTPVPGALRTVATLPASIEISLTDGIARYPDSHFNNPNGFAVNRPLRKTAINVSLFVVTAGAQPDSVNLILALGDMASLPDLVVGGVINPALFAGTDYFRIPCSKTAPNTWVGYIPSNNLFINYGNNLRFIVEVVKSGTPTYADHDSELDLVPPGFPNDHHWTFNISTTATYTPWPTRILNNVITDKNPVAYPAYYLSEDAHVTIEVYDIKGRPLVKLIDNGFRRGGQNIKEGGWRGENKAGRKLGIGLYYIRFHAKSVSSGKTILNSFQKVVIAK